MNEPDTALDATQPRIVVIREICYGCSGKGEVWRRSYENGGFGDEPEPCSICNGRGEIVTERLEKP